MESDLAKAGDRTGIQRDRSPFEYFRWYCLQYLQAFERTGSVEAKKVRKRPELDYPHQLGLVLDNPKLYLREVCHRVKEITNTEVSPATICNLLASHGITRKKIQHVALQRRVEYRLPIFPSFQKKSLFGWTKRAVTTVKCWLFYSW